MKRLLLTVSLVVSCGSYTLPSQAADGVVIQTYSIAGWSGRKAYKVRCNRGGTVTIKPCSDGKWGTSCSWGGSFRSFEDAVNSYC